MPMAKASNAPARSDLSPSVHPRRSSIVSISAPTRRVCLKNQELSSFQVSVEAWKQNVEIMAVYSIAARRQAQTSGHGKAHPFDHCSDLGTK